MGISLELVNFEEMFRHTPIKPVILNDVQNVTEKDKERIDRLTSGRYDTDLLSNEPQCECGELVGGYNLGVICNNCNTPVRDMFEQELQPIVWMRAPHGVEKLINPVVLAQLSNKISKVNFNIIEWICNTNYQASSYPPEIDELLMAGVERGYNNFVRNFDKYIDILFNLKSMKTKRKELDDMRQLIYQQRDCIFSEFLPLPNKTLFVIENTKVGIYVDTIIAGAIDAIKTMASIDVPEANYSVRQKENRVAKALFTLVDYYMSVYHDILASKNGIFRKHVYGTRNNFSIRAVISSNTKAHSYDELHIPWATAVTKLKIHLMNKLFKLGYSPNEATALLQEYTVKYHPLLDSMFKEIISENPSGIPVIINRNPSLTRASCQQMFITKVKTDTNDCTISFSILSVRGPNADQVL